MNGIDLGSTYIPIIVPLHEIKNNQIFHYFRCITPKRVMDLLKAHLRVLVPEEHSSFQRNVAAMATLCPI